MRFLPLLGQPLKSDDIIDVLETYGMEVIYDFDRLHENQPDSYSSAAKSEGFEFRFDEQQRLITVFLYLEPLDGFGSLSQDEFDIPFFSSVSEAEDHARSGDAEIKKGFSDLLGVPRDWIRLDYQTYSCHYEFHRGCLAMVTISEAQPGGR